MAFRVSRREFLNGLGAMSAATALAPLPGYACFVTQIYPPMDWPNSGTPISPAPPEMRFGYASITWGGNDRQAMEDIASLGFHGIQLRANVIKEFGSPAELRELLGRYQLKMVALSSGNVRLDPALEAEEIAKHTANAKFAHDVGGLYLQVTDEGPQGRTITAQDYRRLGQLISEIGKRTADLGVSLGYHNHMGTLGERPEAVDQILQAADPRYAKLELDVAHYFQGGGDPAKAIEKYSDQLLFLHIKDVEPLTGDTDARHAYRFVELGRGKVDLPAAFDALHRVKFNGWAIVELDGVPDKTRTPKESGAISKKYLEEKLGVTI